MLVPYVYEVETSRVSTAGAFLPQLEEKILLNLAASMMSCDFRRNLHEKSWISSIMQRFLNAEQVQCSVRGIESLPDDVAIVGGEKEKDIICYSRHKSSYLFLKNYSQ